MAIHVTFEWIKKPNGILRVMALLYNAVVLALINYAERIYEEDWKNFDLYSSQFVHTITPSSFFILLFFVFSYTCGETQIATNFATEVVFDVSFFFLHTFAGIVALYSFTESQLGVTHDKIIVLLSGVFFIVLAVVLFVDAIFMAKKRGKE